MARVLGIVRFRLGFGIEFVEAAAIDEPPGLPPRAVMALAVGHEGEGRPQEKLEALQEGAGEQPAGSAGRQSGMLADVDQQLRVTVLRRTSKVTRGKGARREQTSPPADCAAHGCCN